MDIFSKIFKNKKSKFINNDSNVDDDIKIENRKNRYSLINNEDIINDNGDAEWFEKSLIKYIDFYDNNICPNCKNNFQDNLKSKIRCNHCGKQFVTRSSFLKDNKKMILTIKDSELLQYYRDNFFILKKISKILFNNEITKNDCIQIKKNLHFNDFDTIIYLLDQKANDNLLNYNLGFYTSNISSKAFVLNYFDENKQALENFLYVCFLDINGAINSGISFIEAFDIRTAFLSPGVLNVILDIKKSLHINDIKLENIFYSSCESKCNFKTPLSIKESWNKIKNEFI